MHILVVFGVLLNFFSQFIILFFLTHNNFSVNYQSFTIALFLALALISLFVGMLSRSHSWLHGLLIGLIWGGLFLLILSIKTPLMYENSLFLLFLIVVISTLFSFLGGFFRPIFKKTVKNT